MEVDNPVKVKRTLWKGGSRHSDKVKRQSGRVEVDNLDKVKRIVLKSGSRQSG